MIRAAAKNHDYVAVVVDAADYAAVLAELAANDGATTPGAAPRARRRRPMPARPPTMRRSPTGSPAARREPAPERRAFGGELPMQTAALRREPAPERRVLSRPPSRGPGVATARAAPGQGAHLQQHQRHRRGLRAGRRVRPASPPAVAIIKHANPCGVAIGATLTRPTRGRLPAIPVSAFGGIVALNRTLDAATAREIVEIFTEVVIAPDADEEALAIFAAKKNLRLLLAGGLPDPRARGHDRSSSVAGGFLVQDRDNGRVDASRPEGRDQARADASGDRATCCSPSRVAKHVKSNAIVYAKDGATVGIGAGQMNRVDSARASPPAQGRGRGEAAGLAASRGERLGRRLRRLLPLRRRPAGRRRGRRHRGDPARRLDPRRRSDRGRRRGGLAMVFTGMRHFRH